MLDPKIIAKLDQAKAELLEVYPPLLVDFYNELLKQDAPEPVAYDLTAQLFQHYLNLGSE